MLYNIYKNNTQGHKTPEGEVLINMHAAAPMKYHFHGIHWIVQVLL